MKRALLFFSQLIGGIIIAPAPAAIAATPAVAQTTPAARDAEELIAPNGNRVIALIIYGEDPCPASAGDEIIVCARKPEAERYRIPKALRDRPKPAGGPGWASQVAEMEKAGQALLPGSCSVIGSNGATGCTQAMLKKWFAERRMDEAANKP
jgi:hypothetical protein